MTTCTRCHEPLNVGRDAIDDPAGGLMHWNHHAEPTPERCAFSGCERIATTYLNSEHVCAEHLDPATWQTEGSVI